jgi:hypothetical protein
MLLIKRATTKVFHCLRITFIWHNRKIIDITERILSDVSFILWISKWEVNRAIYIYLFQFSKFKYFSIYIIYGIFSGRISRSHVWIWSCVHIKNERKTRQFLLMVGSRNFHHLISWPHILYIKWKLTKISFKNRLTKYIILILRQLRHWNFEASFCLVAIQNQTGLVILGWDLFVSRDSISTLGFLDICIDSILLFVIWRLYILFQKESKLFAVCPMQKM